MSAVDWLIIGAVVLVVPPIMYLFIRSIWEGHDENQGRKR